MSNTASKGRSGQSQSGRSLHNHRYKELSDDEAKAFFPPISKIDRSTGEFLLIYQYKGIMHWKTQFVKPDKPDFYRYPDYLIIKEYFRKHGCIPKGTRFTDMVRELIVTREYRAREIIIYDNTGLIEGDIMYHFVCDQVTGNPNILVNYLFANRPNFRPHPLQNLKK